MKTDELREKYLDFFDRQGHQVCPSDVLVPTWDKSVLFTPAGMNPFKDHFLGNVELEFTRATSCQKCLRTGDIENVGKTAYHHTFFEMLGNFSFGDYFKREAIIWAWEFLTQPQWLAIDPNKLTVTVYQDDQQAAAIWENDIGLSSDRIQYLGEYDNFWPAGAPTEGPDGVCGPCSEIFFHPHGIGRGADVEIWNLVFTQFNRSGPAPDNLIPLPHNNIDTGMGLERAAASLQGVDTNFHIDILRPIVEAAAEITAISYVPESNEGRFLRRITDHVRACTFAIHENVYPGPTKAEYVVRRLLRRCTLEGHQLGRQEPFLYQLVPAIVQSMTRPYPELAQSESRIQQVIHHEESRFLTTLDEGLVRINRIFAEMEAQNCSQVPGGAAADLYHTFGIPPELVESLAKDRGGQFDWPGFQSAMQDHSARSGKIAESVMGDFGPVDQIKKQCKSTRFLGYETTTSSGAIVGLIDNDWRVDQLSNTARGSQPDASPQPWQIIVLDQTPFYAESGGQVADIGIIRSKTGDFQVEDVQKSGEVILHYGHLTSGTMVEGDSVQAVVDPVRRQAIRRAHTATHLLHHSLQQTLGSHAQQRGSKVGDDWLRFDFSNQQPVSERDLAAIESATRNYIGQSTPVAAQVLPLSDARRQGAMMLFGEKYPDPVRMITVGDFSKELCGGTHVSNSSEIGAFEIVSEESVAAGTRRIEALTGEKAISQRRQMVDSIRRLKEILGVGESNIATAFQQLTLLLKELNKQIQLHRPADIALDTIVGGQELGDKARRELLKQLARSLNVSPGEVPDRVAQLQREIVSLQLQLHEIATREQVSADSLWEHAEQVDGFSFIVRQLPQSNANLMRQLIDQLRKTNRPVAVFLATTEGDQKVILVAGVSHQLVERGIRAGDWVKQIAPLVGGGGGGKPDLAQAGGKHPENIPQALQAAKDFLLKQCQLLKS